MPAFPFTTKIFRTIRRFDAAFSALLNNANNEIGSRSTVSMTEKVRMRSLVEETRVNAVNTASASGRETRVDDLSDDDDDEMELDHEEEDEDEIDDRDRVGSHGRLQLDLEDLSAIFVCSTTSFLCYVAVWQFGVRYN